MQPSFSAFRLVIGLLAMYASVASAQGQGFYVTSNDNDQVLQYDAGTGGFVRVVDPLNIGLRSPTGIILGPDGRIYVASSFNNNVLRLDRSTGTFSVFTTGGSLDEPKGLAFGPDGNLYVASSGTGNIQKFDRNTGAFLGVFTSGGGLTTPTGIAFGPDRNLYVTDPDNNFVLKYDGTTGAFLSTFIAPAVGGVCEPQALVFGPDRNLYVTSSGDTADGDNCGIIGAGSDAVLKYDGTTGAFLGNFVASKAGGLADPVGLVFGPDGNLYVASEDSEQVLKFNGATGAFIGVFVTAGSGGLSGPNFLAFDAVPAFLISYASNLSVGDSVINISNSGANGASLQSGTVAGIVGSICVNVYAFTPDEQMVSCCSCPVTPNGLVSLSVKSDLASNTLTPAVPTAMVIKLVATAVQGTPGVTAGPNAANCNNSAATVGQPAAALANGLSAWASTLHVTPAAGTFGVTENRFTTPTAFVAGEAARLGSLCNFIIANGSGFGICRSCRLGGLGAERQ